MTPINLLALADRVEKLTGPDRATDGAIWAAVQGVELLIFEKPPSSGEVLSYRGSLNHPDWAGVGPYTASLDAAMTLVPEGLVWDVTSTGTAWVDLTGSGEIEIARAKSPALALTAACLRARASTDKGEA
jgi:hypothetical protein